MSSNLEIFLPHEDQQTGSRNLYRSLLSVFSQEEPMSPMSPLERATLNPCEKLQRYGKIPWKLSVHSALVIATSLMVYLWSYNDALHIRHSSGHFHRALLGISGGLPADRTVEIPFSEDLKNQLDETVEGYWKIDDSKLTDYSLCKGPLRFSAFYKADNGVIESESVALTEDSWRENAAYQLLSTNMTSKIVQYSVLGVVHDKFEGPFWHQCLRWSLNTVFDYGGTGLVVGSIEAQISECSKDGSTNWGVPITVIVLAVISCLLTLRAHRLGRSWFLVNVGANCVQVLASLGCLRLVYRMDVMQRFALIGLAAGSAWICLLRYLRYFHIYYVLVRTLSRAVPQCARFVVGVSPILLGYALLGNCLFFKSPMFATIPGSIATLFSLLNGDIIRDTFSDVSDLVPFWGQMYLYSFLCLFIYVVLHIFISIVEEAYFAAKHARSPGIQYFEGENRFEYDTTELLTGFSSNSNTPMEDPMDSLILSSIQNQLFLLRQNGKFLQLKPAIQQLLE